MGNIWHDINPKRISPDDFMVVVEISKGCKNKYELDKETGLLKLDRILYIPFDDPMYNSYTDISELPSHMFDEMKHFFEVYKTLEGKTTAVDEIIGSDKVQDIIKYTIGRYKDSFC